MCLGTGKPHSATIWAQCAGDRLLVLDVDGREYQFDMQNTRPEPELIINKSSLSRR